MLDVLRGSPSGLLLECTERNLKEINSLRAPHQLKPLKEPAFNSYLKNAEVEDLCAGHWSFADYYFRVTRGGPKEFTGFDTPEHISAFSLNSANIRAKNFIAGYDIGTGPEALYWGIKP